MTAVTCQRSRIVSPTGIVPIRRYIFVAFRDFFPKTARRRTASENDQATITCGPFAGRKTGERRRRCRDDGRPRRRPAIDFLSSSRVYDISPRFDTTRNLSACHACLSPNGTTGPRICLSRRTPAGCCLDIMEKRRRTACKQHPWKHKNVSPLH